MNNSLSCAQFFRFDLPYVNYPLWYKYREKKQFFYVFRESENFEVESEEGRADLSECPNNKFDDFDDDYENELSSHETRERRKNLNLSPLRKEVRLPDMYNSPVQAGSGIDLLDLAKLAEERTESTDFLNKSGNYLL